MPDLPQVGALEHEPVGQAVFDGGLLRQRDCTGLNIDAGNVQIWLLLQEQQEQQRVLADVQKQLLLA